MNAPTFEYTDISNRVRQTLREAFGDNTVIVTEEGYRGRIHVKIVSERFNGMGERQKQNYIWDIINAELDKEAQQAVSVVMCYSTDEL